MSDEDLLKRNAHLEEMFHGWRAEAIKADARIRDIEDYVDGLVRTHSRFAAAAQGCWSGKKQRVRAAEASQTLAFIRKVKATA